MRLTSKYSIHLLCLFILCFSFGCQPTRTIAGFDNYALRDYADVRADISTHIIEFVQITRRAIDRQPDLTADDRSAFHALYDSLLPLSNDHPDFLMLSSEYEHHILKQVLPPERRPPLQLYPRLTHPHIAEPARKQAAPPSSDSERPTWFVPLALSTRALKNETPTRVVSFLERIAELFRISIRPDQRYVHSLLNNLSFWLAPVDAIDTPQSWLRLTTPVHRPFPIGVTGFDLAQPDSSVLGLVFRIQHKEKSTGPDTAPPGFYHLRILPRLASLPSEGLSTRTARSVADGRWQLAKTDLYADLSSNRLALGHELSRIAHAARAYQSSIHGRPGISYFAADLTEFRKCCEALSKLCLDRNRTLPTLITFAKRKIEPAIDAILYDHCPAPVLLDDPYEPEDEPFSFIVAADLQYHRRVPEIVSFFSYLNGNFGDGRLDRVDKHLQARIREAKFVLIAGDLADGASGSVPPIGAEPGLPGSILLNSLGLLPPQSPYSFLGEMKALRNHLRVLRKPVFAVPGNHDGIVGYGGVLNFPLDSLAETLNELPWIRHCLAPFVFRVNDFIPNGYKFHVPNTATMIPRNTPLGQKLTPPQGDGALSWFFAPRYDGLVEWRWYLGPLNVAFGYRNCSFIGLNSYNLSQPDRAGVGPLVSSWGGGVQARDIGWLEAMLESFASRTGRTRKKQFLFMHHDPRGFTPKTEVVADKGISVVEKREPAYDATDAWGNYLTFGYGGFQYAPAWGFFIPVITPLVEYAIYKEVYKERLNKEWMKGYGEERLVDVIGNQANEGRIDKIFFGHNDLPLHSDRCRWWDCEGRVFRKAGEGKKLPLRLAEMLVKIRREGPPRWTNRAVSRDGGSNPGVVRLDDVSNRYSWGGEVPRTDEQFKNLPRHGFHVVTVFPNAVNVDWVPLPQTPGPP